MDSLPRPPRRVRSASIASSPGVGRVCGPGRISWRVESRSGHIGRPRPSQGRSGAPWSPHFSRPIRGRPPGCSTCSGARDSIPLGSIATTRGWDRSCLIFRLPRRHRRHRDHRSRPLPRLLTHRVPRSRSPADCGVPRCSLVQGSFGNSRSQGSRHPHRPDRSRAPCQKFPLDRF